MGDYYGGFRPYVPVAQRRAQAAREVARRIKDGEAISPIRIEGRTIASTFWGKAWCTNLESYSDFANRLPRGRTYVRNGSVVHLKIDKGRVAALVSGSELYEVKIEIASLSKENWRKLKRQSAGKIGTLVELLQGKLSHAVMGLVTDRRDGLFPNPCEIKMRCSCPDYAGMCKHVAAVMYGVGNRLDASPELLFVLRGVDHLELIEQAIPDAPVGAGVGAPTIAPDELGAIFDIEIDEGPNPKANAATPEKRAGKPASKKASAAKVAQKPAARHAVKKASAAKRAVTKASVPKVAEAPAAKQAARKASAAKPAAKPASKMAARKASTSKSAAKVADTPASKKAVAKPSAAKKKRPAG